MEGNLMVCPTSLSNLSPVSNPFTPDSAKSKIDEFSKIAVWGKFKNKQHHSKVLLNSFPNEWLHFRAVCIESKVSKKTLYH